MHYFSWNIFGLAAAVQHAADCYLHYHLFVKPFEGQQPDDMWLIRIVAVDDESFFATDVLPMNL